MEGSSARNHRAPVWLQMAAGQLVQTLLCHFWGGTNDDSGKMKSNSECHVVGIAAHHTHWIPWLSKTEKKKKGHLLPIFTSHLHFWLPTCFSHTKKCVRKVKHFPLQPQHQLGSVAVFQMFAGPRARHCKCSSYSEFLSLLFRPYNLQQFHLHFASVFFPTQSSSS